MKQRAFIVLLIAVLNSACHNDLDVLQKSAIISTNMWESENDATAAMYGVFNQLRNALNEDYIHWGDFRAGTIGPGTNYRAAADLLYENVLTGTTSLGTNWRGLYTTINDCNQLIKYTPGISFVNEENRNEILANAYFIRAFCYFYIARIWGDAPLLLEGFESEKQDGLFPERGSVSLIYNQIAVDIDQALDLMPASVNARKTGSQGAINMLKADYYLWMAKTRDGGMAALTAAEEAVDAVLGDTNYELLSNYATVFNTKGNREIIFSLHFEKDEYEGGYPQDYLIPLQFFISDEDLIETEVKIGSHAQWYCFSTELQQLLLENSGDKRTPVSFGSFTDTDMDVTYKWINKFPGEWLNGTRYFTSDIPIYRFSEAILFKAELNSALGKDGVTELNKIAQRAYGETNYYPASLSGTALDEAILTERLKEFAAEGKSWWDYIRLGFAFTKIPSLVGRQDETNILLWPVNAGTLNGNPNIEQTEGYH